jgi:cytochrome c biogenesis protein CcmG, thiol:disulfide interchange protein DsbE
MKIKIFISYAIPAIILFLFFLGLNSGNRYSTENLVGKKISNFTLVSLVNNEIIDNDNLSKNDFTLINFWASWCAPCRLEHSFLMSLSEKYDLKILGINFKDNKENSLKFLKELGNPYYDIGKDIDGKVSIKFGVYGVPESILIDKNLKIVKKFIGPLDLNNLREILEITEINK